MTKDPTFWLLARASGITAYVLMTLVVLAGLVLKARPLGRRIPAAKATDVHRFLSLLALGSLVVHGLALVLDTTVKITPAALVVPGLSAYRPLPTALGVLAAELAALIVVSFSLRRRIGMKTWRRLHWTTYIVFVAATAHGLLAGTDSSRSWALALYLGAVGAVAFATAWRALDTPARRPSRPTPPPVRKPKRRNHVQDRDRPVAV